MERDSKTNEWMGFLAGETPTKGNVPDIAMAMKSAKEWRDSHRETSMAAVEFLCNALACGPVHASCLGVLHEKYGIPKPVSAWVRLFPNVFKYYAAKANSYLVDTPACALVQRMNDKGYWDCFRTTLNGGTSGTASDIAMSAWDVLGIPEAKKNWSRIRVDIFRAFLLSSGFIQLTSAHNVSQEFLHKTNMKIVDFFSGRRMKDVSLSPEGQELCEWKVAAVPPFLSVRPIGVGVKFFELSDSLRDELRQKVCVLVPEQIDFSGIAHRGNITVESVYVAYLNEISQALLSHTLRLESVAKTVITNAVNSTQEKRARKFSAIVFKCYRKADGNHAVLLENCLDECDQPLRNMEGVLYDLESDFIGRLEDGDEVIGEYEEMDSVMKIVSLKPAKSEEIFALEKVCAELLSATTSNLFFEQDTIERLIVPTLRYLGWNVDGVSCGQMVRGNRDNRSNHRPFDLNLYKDLSSGFLSVGIECKDVAKDFPCLFDEPSVSDIANNASVSSSNLPGLLQVVNDYLSDKYGIGNVNSKVKYGYTVIVWTNWRTWVVIRNEFANVSNDPPVEAIPLDAIKFNGHHQGVRLQFRRFNLFDSNSVNVSMMRALKSEIGEEYFRNAPYPEENENVYQ